MEWLLGISVVFIIVLLIIVSLLVYGLITAQNEAEHNHQEWQRWEQRWYEAQGMLIEEHNLFLSAIQGAYGKMVIKEHKRK